MFSVITPSFNCGTRIEETILSVLGQQNVELEHVVVDGASTDQTMDVVRRFSGRPGFKHVSEADQGVYDAMNKGIRLSRFPWLLFLGGNDRLASPNVLSKVAEHIRSNPDARGVTGYVYYDDGRKRVSRMSNWLISRNTMHHQATFYHRSLFTNRSYDSSLRVSADYEFNLYLYKTGTPFSRLDVQISTCDSLGLADTPKLRNYLEEIKSRHRHFSFVQSALFDLLSLSRYGLKKCRRKFGL